MLSPKKLIAWLLLVLLALPLPALAAEEGAQPAEDKEKDKGWGVELTMPLYSKYLSRGALTVDDPVLQPGATLSGYGFSFNVWGNYNLTNKIGKKNKFSEVDLTAEYAFEAGGFSFPLGVVQYLYPNVTQPNTTELYAGVSYTALITPTLKVYQDVGDVHGTLANFTLSLNHEVTRLHPALACCLLLTGGLDWGSSDYNKYRYNAGVDKSAFIDTYLTLGVPFKYKDFLTLTPSYTHVFIMDSEIKDAFGYSDKGFFGLALTVAF